MSATADSAETLALASRKLAPQAMMLHSAAVVQNRIPAAIQITPGRRPLVARDGGGASIASRLLLHHASIGTASEINSASRQPACTAAIRERATISRR